MLSVSFLVGLLGFLLQSLEKEILVGEGGNGVNRMFKERLWEVLGFE